MSKNIFSKLIWWNFFYGELQRFMKTMFLWSIVENHSSCNKLAEETINTNFHENSELMIKN